MGKKKRRSLYDTLSARDNEQDHELQETFQRVREINTKQPTAASLDPVKTPSEKLEEKSPSEQPKDTAQTKGSHKEPTQPSEQKNNSINKDKKEEVNENHSNKSSHSNGSFNELTNTAQINSSSEQPKDTAQVKGSPEQPKSDGRAQSKGSNEPFNRALQAQSLSPSNEPYSQAHQMSPSRESSKPFEDPQNVFLKPKSLIRSKNQRTLFDYLQRTGSQTTTITYISKITGVPYSTTKRIISKFQAEGLICYETLYVQNVGWCAKIWLLKSDSEPYNRAVQMSPMNEPYEWAIPNASKTDRESICLEEGGPGGDTNPSASSPEARLKNLTNDDIEFFWPKLHQSGFGTHQVQQIVERLYKVGKPPDKVMQSLDHAEWELENDKMADKEGKAVSNPCSYVFNSLAKHGYYRRPSGYISPEEQAELDAKEEADRLQKVNKEKKESQFKAWKATLSEEEINTILKDKTHKGPNDPWLKQYWKKNIVGN